MQGARRLARPQGRLIACTETAPGSGPNAAQVAKAPAAGYTLLMGAVHHTIATSVYPKLPYDFQKDFAPITIVATMPNVLAVNPGVPARNVKELLAYGKANPGKLTYGSNGHDQERHREIRPRGEEGEREDRLIRRVWHGGAPPEARTTR